MLPLNDDLSRELDQLMQSNESLIRLAFRARKKLGIVGVTQLRRAIGNVSRQQIYRVLTPQELKELRSCKS